MNWNILNSIEEVEKIKDRSYETPCLIFKHSTTCSISHLAKSRLERDWFFDELIIPYYLDLKNYRAVSNHIADTFDVYHESPQVLLIRNGECSYDASHLDITAQELNETLLFDRA
jgi:bacillithiol system protein YtxJ